ncbi:hypothetical protein KKG66_09260, partial [bacterium]|nr:hypothetical protein [bacterium]
SIRPEFLNRIDEILVFGPLSRENLREVVDIQLRRVAERLKKQNLEIEVTQSAKDYILEHGYDPVFGARPLKRALQTELLNPLSEEILSGRIMPGMTIHVDRDHDQLKITTANKVETA